MFKRIFDIILSLIGLIILCPFFLAIAILIKLDSRGPVFYSQTRIGKNGKPFEMLKFRTMVEAKHWTGPPLSPMNDPRVTGFGAILRRFKINEFPQLINVLKGEMSFVGPRPEVPEFVKLYNEEQARVLSVRPGIVGPTQIYMRNEEELYSEGVNPQQHYIEEIMPKKLEIDLAYISNRSFLKDIGYVLWGVMITITGALNRRHFFENAEQLVAFVCDALVCAFSYYLAYFLRMEGTFPAVEMNILLHTLPYVVLARMLAFTSFGLYGTLIRYVSFDELIKVIKGATLSSGIIVLLTFFVGHRPHPRSVFVIDWFIVISLLIGYRLSFNSVKDYLSRRRQEPEKNLLIYGAGRIGDLALRYLKVRGEGRVIAFLDDDPKNIRKTFHGIKVLGTRYDIESLARLYRIDQVIIAKRHLPSDELEQIKSLCEKAKVQCEVFALAN
jgi:lipopolysaccharide/colanic/teichoic acid biosynthesis glycosyltransferase